MKISRMIREIQNRRMSRVDREGSPYFDVYLPSIAANSREVYNIDTYSGLAEARKYQPLDYIQVINNDSVPLEIGIKNQRHYAPAGTIITISDEAVWGFSIKNLDSSVATTANKIHVVLQRQPLTEDRKIRRGL